MIRHHILLVRHGKAEDENALGDEARGLTEEGREEFRQHTRDVVAPRTSLEGVATSPLVRAVQTAEILAGACGVARIEVHGDLAFASSATAIDRLARQLGPGWALVGHNPTMSEALATMLGRPDTEPPFRKGTVVALVPGKGQAGLWSLAWIADPGRKPSKRLDL